MGWSQELFRTVWRALSKEVKELVGTDHFGNKYYYIPAYKNWRACFSDGGSQGSPPAMAQL
uniref:NADH:ubiquinone oxidoreductase complex assembly factor 2 n=1 Tax=Myotis myotis TaxID=51298 RepID=A0A7J7Y0S9_MYOMY|nr:NADH:ubiquinone oxidoreductase complex assembly factor 2 [Myotis myotis]